jgi:hypothetical protein
MAEKIEIPEEEILEKYKNVWWTPAKLAKKYKTTEYRIRKLLTARGVLRKSTGVEQVMIKNLLKYERQFDKNTTPHEMYVARKLLQEYPDDEFWKGFMLPFKLNSLAFLQSPAGQLILNKKWGEYKFELPEVKQHNIGTEKVGEDLPETVTKPKSIHDFLKR